MANCRRIASRQGRWLALAALLGALLGMTACDSDGIVLGATVDVADWSLIEPDHPRLATGVAAALDAAVCIDRVGATSVGRANAVAALLQLDGLPGVDISVTVRDINCGSDSTIFANPGLADLLVTEVTDTCLGSSLGATAAVCYHTAGPAGPLWTVNDCAVLGGCEADHAVLMLRESNYTGTNEPSVGVIAHELGHAVGLVHGYWSSDECAGAVPPPTQARALDEHIFMSHTVVRGTGRGVVHGDDGRRGLVSAYTLAYLQDRYPAATVTYTTPEWYAHEMVLKRDACGSDAPVTPATTWESQDFPPDQLCLDSARQVFVDCATNADPTFTLQFSSKSGENCTDGAYPRLLLDGAEVARGATAKPDCATPLVQYEWTVSAEIAESLLDPAIVLPHVATFELEVVSISPVAEAEPSDNGVMLEVTLNP